MPLALQFGMSNREFWDDEPETLWAYRKFYMNKLKTEREIYNAQAWLQGVYIFDAIGVALHNAFMGKNRTPKSYLEKPIDIESTNRSKEERDKEKLKILEAKLTNQFNMVKIHK